MDSDKQVDFPGGTEGKVSACNAGDPGSIPGSGRSPGEGNGNPLQYSCLENPMDRGAWWATVHGVAKSRTQLSNFTFFHFPYDKSKHVGLRRSTQGRENPWGILDKCLLNDTRVLNCGLLIV